MAHPNDISPSELDALHAVLRAAHEADADDDSDFDWWVSDVASNDDHPLQAEAVAFRSTEQ